MFFTKYHEDDQVKKIEMGGACGTYEGEEKLMQYFGGKPKGPTPLRRPRRQWEDNIKMVLEKWDGGINWIDLTWDWDRWHPFVNAVINFRIP